MSSTRLLLCLGLLLSLGACKRSFPEASRSAPGLDACAPPPPAPVHGGPLRWYEDDLPPALACGKRLGRPVVVDLWAPWCHTCLSMQQTVLNDPSLAGYAERFVWVSLDTDRPDNEAAVGRYPPLAWPTFYVISADDGAIAARHVGGASLDQMTALFDEGLRVAAAPAAAAPSPALLVRDAHAAEAKQAYAEAADLYARALEAAPAKWGRRPDILVAQIRALSRAGRNEACLELAEEHGTRTGISASAADFAFYAHRCADALDYPEGSRALLARLAEHVGRAVDAGDAMSVDDRADALRILREIRLALGEQEAARALAERQRALLDAAIAEAEPALAMTYNWPAAEVYAFLGIPEDLVPTLEANLRALPDEYDPPYRLAWLLLKAEQPGRALPYIERALELVYGPRKAQAYALAAEIHAARGDREAERAARAAAIEVLERLPEGQRDPKKLEAARAALAELSAASMGDGLAGD